MDSGFFILSSKWVSFASGASFGARTLLFCYFSGCFEDAVIAVTREVDQFPYDDHLELLLGSILDQVLETRSVIGSD